MNSLVLSGFGNSIYVEKRKLVIFNKIEDKKLEFYPHKIDYDSIIIDGHTGNITFEAMRWLMKHNINVSLLNWNGLLLANVLPEQPKSGKLRVKQYEKYLDTGFRFDVATKIVYCKTMHSLNLLKELAKYYEFLDYSKIEKSIRKEESQISHILKKNDKLLSSIYDDDKPQISSLIRRLMTNEGRIAEIYAQNMRNIFNKITPEFHYTGRKDKANSRNYNASDEINALLNYGYSVLESEARKAINSVGLDYSVGFLHEVSQSKIPLVYDIQEAFRWIVDLSVIQLLEEKKLKKSDFIITENYHIRLRENTAKMLVGKINQNFNLKVLYKDRKNHSYHNILVDNVQNLANFISEKRKQFDFNIPKINLQRNDNLQIREKILNMTSEEMKTLGINKSTLWSIKKNLKSGKRISIYDKVLSKIQ